MVANDFASLFDAHLAIDRVFFNGAAAEKNFGRLVRADRPIRGYTPAVDEPGPNHALRGQTACLADTSDRT